MELPVKIGNQWQSIYTLSSFPIGTALKVYNLGRDPIEVVESTTQPLENTQGVGVTPFSFVTVNPDSNNIWVKCNSPCYIFIQDKFAFSFNDNGIDPRVYTGYQGFTIQSFVEANIKNGTQFSISVEATLPANSKKYYAFKTPNNPDKTIIIKNRFIETDGGIRYKPYVGATFTEDNPPLTTWNLNGKSTNVAEAQIHTVTEANISDVGQSFDVIRTASGQGNNRISGIFTDIGIERILPDDTWVLVEFENLEGKELFVVYSLTWYEGPLSSDIA